MELSKQGRKSSGVSAQSSGLFVENGALFPFTSQLFLELNVRIGEKERIKPCFIGENERKSRGMSDVQ